MTETTFVAEEAEEVSETILLEPWEPMASTTDLPASPKKAFIAARDMGWDVIVCKALGRVDPVYFLENSKEDATDPHNAGDVRYEGYLAKLFMVEARDPDLPLGFLAFYTGKEYETPRKTKPSAGAFDYARVVDPVGLPVLLRATYEPIRQTRGEYETDKSFQKRKDDAQKMADEMDARYNDGAITFRHQHMFTSATPFTEWLKDWKPFYTIKEATL